MSCNPRKIHTTPQHSGLCWTRSWQGIPFLNMCLSVAFITHTNERVYVDSCEHAVLQKIAVNPQARPHLFLTMVLARLPFLWTCIWGKRKSYTIVPIQLVHMWQHMQNMYKHLRVVHQAQHGPERILLICPYNSPLGVLQKIIVNPPNVCISFKNSLQILKQDRIFLLSMVLARPPCLW